MTDADEKFDQAVRARSMGLVRKAVAELPRIELHHAAAMLLVIADREPHNYGSAARRWLSMLCDERARVGSASAQAVSFDGIGRAAYALELLPQDAGEACAELSDICQNAGLIEAARVFAPAPVR